MSGYVYATVCQSRTCRVCRWILFMEDSIAVTVITLPQRSCECLWLCLAVWGCAHGTLFEENINYCHLYNYIICKNLLRNSIKIFFPVFYHPLWFFKNERHFLSEILQHYRASSDFSDFWLFFYSNKHAYRVNGLDMNLKSFKIMILIFILALLSYNSVTI